MEYIVNFEKILSENPASFFAIVGAFILILFGFRVRKIKLNSRMTIHISLMLALSILLHQLRLYHFPQGGSVTLGGMIPLLMLSFRYGSGTGTLAGFVYGIILMIQDPFILHPLQVLFDYPLPYMAAGLAGLFREKFILATCLTFVGRFLCNFISGVIFFASYAPEGMSPAIYSLTVNAGLLIPECLICCIILKFLPVKRLLDAMDKS